MVIDYNTFEEKNIPNFKGGTGAYDVKMFADSSCKIMKGRLTCGSSIGFHVHETDMEIIYVLSGKGVMITNDKVTRVTLTPGQCYYCPKGEGHSFLNEEVEDLIFFAVVPAA